MKLNPDIVSAELQAFFPVELMGTPEQDMVLERPEFYLDSQTEIRTGHFYILTSSKLPQTSELKPGYTFLCCEPLSVPHQLLTRGCVIRLKQKESPFAVMNAITGIYDRYSRWFEQLHQIVETTADIPEMTELTSQTLRNPVMVLDAEFRVLAAAGYDDSPQPSIPEQILNTEFKTQVTDPVHMKLMGHEVLSYNLFDTNEYAGSITIEYQNRPYNPGDDPLIRLFAHFLMLAMRQHFQFLSSGRSLLRQTFQTLMEGMPLSAEDQKQLQDMQLPAQWRCMVLQPCQQVSPVPVSYICSQLESKLSPCIAFSYENNIAAFLSAESPVNTNSSRENFIQQISRKLETENLKIGVSSLFSDLSTVSWHYKQAVAALKNGMLSDPGWTFYFFEEYALDELVLNSTGDEPLEMYYSDGLKKLFEHDASSSTSYIDTLRTYLNNNMNVTATAEQLCIHRSTLMERLARIKRELWDDLSDSDIQLRLRIILKALELRNNRDQ